MIFPSIYLRKDSPGLATDNLRPSSGFVTASNHDTKPGFTLVELLVVMVIIGIMGGFLTAAIQGVTSSARASRTRTIVSLIDSVIQERYDSYKYRSLPVEIPTAAFVANTTGSTLSFEVLGSEAARVRLNMIRDLQRMEMPDRFSDFGIDLTTTFPFVVAPVASTISGAANRVLVDTSDLDMDGDTTEILPTRGIKTQRVPFAMSWFAGGTGPSLIQAYQARVTAGATTQFQDAECLFLIMSTTYASGTPAIDSIPTSNIGDTDNDGMFEILDGWSQPIRFIRWPVGYNDVDGQIDLSTPDEFDLFRSDFYFTDAAPPAPSSTVVLPAVDVNAGATQFPWALRPLVISSGEDGQAGIAFDPVNASGIALTTYSYNDTAADWPINVANMGTENAGRGAGTYQWVDPYFRRFIAANDPGVFDRQSDTYNNDTQRRLPGEELTGGFTNAVLADNITNFSLQAAQ